MSEASDGAVARVWLYSNQAMVARVVERRHGDGSCRVEIEGPAAMRGQHRFVNTAECTAFVRDVDGQLAAAGFECLWRSSDRRTEPGRAANPWTRDRQPTGLAQVLHYIWSERLARRSPPRVGLLSEDWVAAHATGRRA